MSTCPQGHGVQGNSMRPVPAPQSLIAATAFRADETGCHAGGRRAVPSTP